MIDFMKYKFIYFLVSGLLILGSIFALFFWKLNLSIDFTGGALLEIEIAGELTKDQEKTKLEEVFQEKEVEISSIQESGDNFWLIRTKPIDETKKNELLFLLEEKVGGGVFEQRFEVVGPTIGKEVSQKTFMAVGVASLAIMIYIAWVSRKNSSEIPSWKFGVCALVAMLHDSFILIGMASVLGHFFKMEVDLLFITAVLTIMSFSVHDTIVVFDRIKETVNKKSKLGLSEVINIALTETMTRSINNSMTIIFMLLALLLLGGQTIFYFILTLLVGTILGTYSSPFVATPILVVWEGKKR